MQFKIFQFLIAENEGINIIIIINYYIKIIKKKYYFIYRLYIFNK